MRSCTAHRRENRLRPAYTLLLLVTVLVLSGCLRYSERLVITADDTVNGTIVVATAADPAATSAAPTTALQMPHSDAETIVVSPFIRPTERGYQVTYTNATFEDVAKFAPLGDRGGALVIVRNGDVLDVTSHIDLTYGEAIDPADAADAVQATVRLQVPGEIISTNGVAEGSVITWDLAVLENNTLKARIAAPPGLAVPSSSAAAAQTSSTAIDWRLAALVGGGLLLLGALGGVLLYRRVAGPSEPQHQPTGPVRAQLPAFADDVVDDPFEPVRVATGEPERIRSSEETTVSAVRPPVPSDVHGGWPPPSPIWRETS